MFVNRPLFRCRGSLSPVHRVQKKKRKRRPPPVSLMTCKRNTAGTWQEVILGEETWNSVVLLSVFYLSFRFPEPPRLVPTHCDWARIYSFQSVVVGDQKRQQNASERKERKEKRLRCRFTDTAPVAAFCYGIGRSPSVLMVDVTFIMDPILAHTHTHTHTHTHNEWPPLAVGQHTCARLIEETAVVVDGEYRSPVNRRGLRHHPPQHSRHDKEPLSVKRKKERKKERETGR